MSKTFSGIRLTALCALLSLAGIPAAWGQATSSLRGVISDPQGAAIDSANVSLLNGQTGFRRSVLTDATGSYQFLQFPPGTYTMTVEKPGFAITNQTNFELLVNTPATLNATMEVA